MTNIAMIAVGAILFGVGLARLRAYMQSGRRKHTGYLSCAATAVGLSLIVNADAPAAWADRIVFHRPSASTLVVYLLVTLGAWAAVEMVSDLTGRAGRTAKRVRLAFVLAVDAVAITSFLRAEVGTASGSFFREYGTQLRPFVLLFGMLFAQLGYVAVVTMRYSRHSEGWLARALVSVSIGALFAEIFVLSRGGDVLTPVPEIIDQIAEGFMLAGILWIGVGMAIPAIGPAIGAMRARKELYPLWKWLTNSCPEVRERPDRRPGLYRTVIEIQDAVANEGTDRLTPAGWVAAVRALDLQPAEQFNDAVDELRGVARGFRRWQKTT